MNVKFAITVCLLVITEGALAQSATVFKGKDITEAALIQALTPQPAVAAETDEEAVTTRSIRVLRNHDSRPAPVRPIPVAKPVSASLLITFEPSSAELTSKAKQLLDVVGQALSSAKLADYRFAIQGHADPRGQSEANLKLSQLRAESVRRYLVTSKHIDDKRLEAVGRGDAELANTTDPTAPENRRVTIVNLAM